MTEFSRAMASMSDDEVRKLINEVMDATIGHGIPIMGSMARANMYHILGLGYGQGDFKAALKVASRTKLDGLLDKAAHYITLYIPMREKKIEMQLIKSKNDAFIYRRHELRLVLDSIAANAAAQENTHVIITRGDYLRLMAMRDDMAAEDKRLQVPHTLA